jgi:hypothetical protein
MYLHIEKKNYYIAVIALAVMHKKEDVARL